MASFFRHLENDQYVKNWLPKKYFALLFIENIVLYCLFPVSCCCYIIVYHVCINLILCKLSPA